MNKRKKVILATIGIGALLAATLVPIFLFTKDNENNNEKDQKIVDDYVEKLKKLTPKEVTIKETSGSIIKNKNSILRAIKNLDKFPSIPNGVTLEVKDDSKNLTLQGTAVTLIVKKLTISKEVTGFKAKRSMLDQEIIDGFVEKLKALTTKEVTISETSGSVTDNKDSIKTKIETLTNFPVVPSGVSWEVKEEATALTLDGVNITLVVSKGLISQEVTGFKAKRSVSDQEVVDGFVEKLKALVKKEVTISQTSGSVTDNKNFIKTSIEILANFPVVPSGVSWEVKEEATTLTTAGVNITLTVSKGLVSQDVTGFKAKRSQSSQEVDQENVNGFVEKLKALTTKEVTISQTSGSVTDNKDSIKSSIETLANFPVVPSGVSWEVKEETTTLTTAGVNITLTVSKGLVSQDVTGFKAKRSQSSQEVDQENVNGFVEKLKALVTKEVTISQTSGSVTDNKDSIKSSIETLANFPVVPSGVSWEVKEEATTLTTTGINITLTVSKGLVSEEVTGFSAKRSISDQEVVDDFILKLNNLVTKEVTISQTSGSVTDNKDSIKSSIENLANFPVVPSGVSWEVKEEATTLTTAGVNITLTVSKGLVSQDVTGFKAKRSQSSQEVDQENVNGFVEKLKALTTKEVTISQTSGSVTDNKDSIKSSIETLANFPVVPSGVSWEVKEEATTLTTAGVNITLTVSKGLVSQDVTGFKAKRSQSSQEVDQENVNGFVEKLKALVTKEVTISQTSGSVTDNKDSIKSSIETLANFPVVPSGVSWEVKEEATTLTTTGINITLTVSKGLVSEEVTGFSAKRSQSSQEIDQENVNGFVEKLKALVTKEVTISQTSGSVTDNKDSIKTSIETLANFPVVPSGLSWEVKDEATVLTLDGVNITLVVKKGLVTEEVTGFSAKRSVSDQEVVDGFVEKLKALVTKEVTISQTSGSVTDNKNSIKTSIGALANFPIVPSGVSWEVKDKATVLTLDGVNITLVVKKGLVTEEVTGFSAKRSVSDQEVVDGFVEKLKALVTKEVTISQTSGSVTDNKDSIKTSIETLANFPVVPSGLSWKVKEEATALTLDGVNITLVVSKGLISQDIRGFSAKRTKTQFELDTDSVNSVKKILDGKDPKLVTIENVQAKVGASGVATKIVAKLQEVIEDNLDGVTIEVKADDNNEDIIDTGDGTGFIITLSKGIVSEEISDWKVLRTKTSDELIAENYKNELINSYKNLSSNDILIEIDSASGTTLEQNKVAIIKAIKETYPFVLPPAGFDIRLKIGQDEIISSWGVTVDIEIFKVSSRNTLALISKDDIDAFIVQKNRTPFEKIGSYFSVPNHKFVTIPYEKPDLTYKNLDENSVLIAVKKALFFTNPDFWTTTLLNEITLKPNQGITNFDVARDVIIKYGKNPNETEVTINVKKLSSGATIHEYFRAYENRNFDISSQVRITDWASVLNAIRDILLNRDSKVWNILRNSIIQSPNNGPYSLSKDSSGYSTFKVIYQFQGAQQEINLSVRHLSSGLEIEKYFLTTNENYEARKISIPSSTATLNTAEKIFDAIKNYLKAKDSSIWKDQLLDELAISNTNNTTSLVKGDPPKPFIVEYTNGANKVTLVLKVKHLS